MEATLTTYIVEAIGGLLVILMSIAMVHLKAYLAKKGLRVDEMIASQGAKKSVEAIEQIGKDLNSEEKYQKAVEYFVKFLNDRNISLSSTDIHMLIESAVLGLANGIKEREESHEK